MPPLHHLDARNRQVHFADDRTLWRVDHIVLCTGYTFSQPFLTGGVRARAPLFPDGPAIANLHEHMVYRANPRLAFVGMVQGGAPTFLVVQAQAAWLSRLWAGRLAMGEAGVDDGLDGREARHLMPYPQFMDYLLRLEKLCEAADATLEEKIQDNLPFKWTLELDFIRQNRREIREAFIATESKSATSLSRLGFSAKRLRTSSPNVNLVIPFLILHPGYFPDRQLRLVRLVLFPRRSKKGEYPGAGFFDQIKAILQMTEAQLQPGSRPLFREGAKRLLEFGLRRVEEAVAHIGGQEERTAEKPETATKRKAKQGAGKSASKTAGSSLRKHQRLMQATFMELFGEV